MLAPARGPAPGPWPGRREGVLYTIEGFLWMRRGGVWARLVSFAGLRMLKATLVSAGVGCARGWRAAGAFLLGYAMMRLRFCGVALW